MWLPVVGDILRLHSDSVTASSGGDFEWCPCMMGFGFMGGGFMGFLWMLLWLVIIIAVVYAIIVFIRNISQPSQPKAAPPGYGGADVSDEVVRLRREIEELRRELRESKEREKS